ncbi:hypothetical protein ACET3Z_027949 [Daucus carota]
MQLKLRINDGHDGRKNSNDDNCSVCYQGGSFIMRDRCPSSVHTVRLGVEALQLPGSEQPAEGSWLTNNNTESADIPAAENLNEALHICWMAGPFKCQMQLKLRINDGHDGRKNSNDDNCSVCYQGAQTRRLKLKSLLPNGVWFCDSTCEEALQLPGSEQPAEGSWLTNNNTESADIPAAENLNEALHICWMAGPFKCQMQLKLRINDGHDGRKNSNDDNCSVCYQGAQTRRLKLKSLLPNGVWFCDSTCEQALQLPGSEQPAEGSWLTNNNTESADIPAAENLNEALQLPGSEQPAEGSWLTNNNTESADIPAAENLNEDWGDLQVWINELGEVELTFPKSDDE